MVVKVYISGISGNYEIRKAQQRVSFVLSSLKIEFEEIDITEMGREEDKEFMRSQCKLNNKAKILPPQIFNDEIYCGDYEDFEAANEDDQLMSFLRLRIAEPQENLESSSQILSNETGENVALKA